MFSFSGYGFPMCLIGDERLCFFYVLAAVFRREALFIVLFNHIFDNEHI